MSGGKAKDNRGVAVVGFTNSPMVRGAYCGCGEPLGPELKRLLSVQVLLGDHWRFLCDGCSRRTVPSLYSAVMFECGDGPPKGAEAMDERGRPKQPREPEEFVLYRVERVRVEEHTPVFEEVRVEEVRLPECGPAE